uniref:Uncharacterized protein n=1 Tax=Brassica oleracea var. oleracea TaxID=109376 RepID=A0A0D3AYC7_BRAOL
MLNRLIRKGIPPVLRILADKEIRVGIREIHFFPAPEQTRHRLGMGSNMYPSASASLFSNHKDESLADVPVEQLIENADAFAAVFPANIGIAVAPTTDAARGASDIHLTKP